MTLRNLTSLAAIGLIAVLGAIYLAVGVVRVNPLDDTITVRMSLPDSGGLAVGSHVLLSGVDIGTVRTVTAAPNGAQLTLDMSARYPIPVDAPVTIENLSFLGEPYVRFDPSGAGGPYLRNGQTVDARRIRPPLSLAELTGLLTQLLGQVDPTAAAAMVDTFATAFHGTDTVVPNLARSTDLLAASIIAHSPSAGQTLRRLGAIAPDMAWAGPSMSAMAPPFIDFGAKVDDIARSIGRLFNPGLPPTMYTDHNGLVPFIALVGDWIRQQGPQLAPLGPALKPLVDVLVSLVPRIDIGSLITQALDGLDPNAIHLQITVK